MRPGRARSGLIGWAMAYANASACITVECRAALDAINAARHAAGVRAVQYSSALAEAAARHAWYVALHPDCGHSEIADELGFTGADPSARARRAGHSGSVGEVLCAYLRGDGQEAARAAVADYLETVYHRHLLLSPDASAVGYGAAVIGGKGANVIDIGFEPRTGSGQVARCPAPAAVGVQIDWDGAEIPDPAPGVPRPLGMPVTLGFGSSEHPVRLERALLHGPHSEVPIIAELWNGAVSALPTRPLAPASEYRVRFDVVVRGRPRIETWTFSTAASPARGSRGTRPR